MISQNPSVACSLSHLKRDLTSHAITLRICRSENVRYENGLFFTPVGFSCIFWVTYCNRLFLPSRERKGVVIWKGARAAIKMPYLTLHMKHNLHFIFQFWKGKRMKQWRPAAGIGFLVEHLFLKSGGRRKMYPNSKSRRAWLWQISPYHHSA